MSNINHLENYWQKQYNNNLKSIKMYLEPPDEQDEDRLAFHKLANWIINQGGIEHLDFLPEGWQSSLCSAGGLDSLLSIIHHAMFDDGEITFVNWYNDGVLSAVFMVFYCKYEDDFIDHCKKALGFRWSVKEEMDSKLHEHFKREPRDSVFVSYDCPLKFMQEYSDLQKQRVERDREVLEWRMKQS